MYLKPDGMEEHAAGHDEEEETAEAERLHEESVEMVVDYEDPGSAKLIATYEERNREKLDPEEVCKGRLEEVEELHEFQVYRVDDEAEMRITPGKEIWSKWVETQKDPSKPEVRNRLCATEVNVGDRSGCIAATPPLKFVRW